MPGRKSTECTDKQIYRPAGGIWSLSGKTFIKIQTMRLLSIYLYNLFITSERGKNKPVFQAGRRDNNCVHMWCLFEVQLWWWDWLVAAGHLARPQEDALAQCGCLSSHNQKLPSATPCKKKRQTLQTAHKSTCCYFHTSVQFLHQPSL